MTIPFLDFFKRFGARKGVDAAPVVMAPMSKPNSDRVGKTVMPNATRTMPRHESVSVADSAPADASAPAATPATRPTIRFGVSVVPRAAGSSVADTLGLDAGAGRTISLALGDVFPQMPTDMVRPLEGDEASRSVALKAVELERGMSAGRPTVSLVSLYQQVPAIFLNPIEPSNAAEVLLPFQKVLEQIAKLQVRSDQEKALLVPQMETPFLKLTLEDDAKFGTKTELPTAEAIAAAEAEAAALAAQAQTPAAASDTPVAPAAKFSIAAPSATGSDQPTPKVPAADIPPPGPTRIPFQVSPKGTDALAPERVPASSEPSVPTSQPKRAAFKLAGAGTPRAGMLTAAPRKPDLVAIKSAAPAPAAPPVDDGVMITLALKPILKSLPPMQLAGDVSGVPDSARLELPFSLVRPQLATGRVSLEPEQFLQYLPAEHRALFNANETAVPVVLPLQEVLSNLPSASLQMRADQVEPEKREEFVTPFSIKAEEDAKRLQAISGPVGKPVPEAATTAVLPETTKPKTVAAPAPPAVTRSPLQAALDTDDELDAKGVVAHIGKMEGVGACAIVFSDGLTLAGNLPDEYEADGLCAMAPSLLQRVENQMTETKLGALSAMTLACSKATVTFLAHDNLCLAALHTNGELSPDVRERLVRTVRELSRKYSHPQSGEKTHVDH